MGGQPSGYESQSSHEGCQAVLLEYKISKLKKLFSDVTCLSVAKYIVFEKLNGNKTPNKCEAHTRKKATSYPVSLNVNLDIKLVTLWY